MIRKSVLDLSNNSMLGINVRLSDQSVVAVIVRLGCNPGSAQILEMSSDDLRTCLSSGDRS